MDGPAVVVRIFLSVLNVHVNRSPADGQVVSLKYTPGAFHDARTPQCAAENESNLIVLRLDDGPTIGLRQIAGKVARRIVCKLSVGDRVEAGKRFGMIKFGSRTNLVLPCEEGLEIKTKVGEKVQAGSSVLAVYQPSAAAIEQKSS